MLYAILYVLGAICFWMWDYESGVTGWKPFGKAAIWPAATVWRAAWECYWRLGNRIIEQRLRHEELQWWDERNGDIKDDPIWTEPENPDVSLQAFFNEHYADDIRASHEARDAMIAEAVDAHFDATNDENSILERPTLDELRIRALGKEEIEDDDGGITFA